MSSWQHENVFVLFDFSQTKRETKTCINRFLRNFQAILPFKLFISNKSKLSLTMTSCILKRLLHTYIIKQQLKKKHEIQITCKLNYFYKLINVLKRFYHVSDSLHWKIFGAKKQIQKKSVKNW